MSDGSMTFSAGRLVRRSCRAFASASAAEKFVVIGLAAIGVYFVAAMVDVLMAPANAPWSMTLIGNCAVDADPLDGQCHVRFD